jgi:ubiquinol-cytochrome c reductase cytochrome b subunit
LKSAGRVASTAPAKPNLAVQLWDWIDERTGAKKILHHTLNEPIPGGARFAYVFGSALLFILLSQTVTGLCLALYYVPSPVTAHVSVSYIVKEVAAGTFLRSLHSYGSSAMVVVLLLHFLQTLFFGSYKGRRELLWVAGCVLSLLILGMAFTGYLLPWDQKAYFASSVGTNVAGQAPIVGEWVRRLLRGGSAMGTLTISRFYVLHVFVIPALIVAFVVAHLFLFRKAGAAGPAHAHPVEPKLRVEMFYPRQVVMDMAFVLVIMGLLGTLAHFVPVKLGPVANPNDSHYLPRPEWYYLPLFQWLKYWEGPRAVIGMVVIPSVLVGLMFLLPFLDRGIERRPWRRPIPVGAVVMVVFGLVWLGIKSHLDDKHDPATAAQLARQQQEEDEYFQKPFEPYRMASFSQTLPAAAPVLSPVAVKGKAIFEANTCNACHGDAGVGGAIGPALNHVASKYPPAKIEALLRNPTAKMRAGGMPPQTLSAEEMSSLIAYLQSLDAPGGKQSVAASSNDNQSVAVAPKPETDTGVAKIRSKAHTTHVSLAVSPSPQSETPN